MKLFENLRRFLKEMAEMFNGKPTGTTNLTDPKRTRRTDGPMTITIPPRKEWGNHDESGNAPSCPHEPDHGRVQVNVAGHEMYAAIPDGCGICRGCFERWLNLHATVCAVCGEPILPGMTVAERSPFDDPPFVHMRPMCCRYTSRLCGNWGWGRLISLHESHPDEIPAGTRTLADHAMRKNPGQPWFEGWNPRIKPN